MTYTDKRKKAREEKNNKGRQYNGYRALQEYHEEILRDEEEFYKGLRREYYHKGCDCFSCTHTHVGGQIYRVYIIDNVKDTKEALLAYINCLGLTRRGTVGNILFEKKVLMPFLLSTEELQILEYLDEEEKKKKKLEQRKQRILRDSKLRKKLSTMKPRLASLEKRFSQRGSNYNDMVVRFRQLYASFTPYEKNTWKSKIDKYFPKHLQKLQFKMGGWTRGLKPDRTKGFLLGFNIKNRKSLLRMRKGFHKKPSLPKKGDSILESNVEGATWFSLFVPPNYNKKGFCIFSSTDGDKLIQGIKVNCNYIAIDTRHIWRHYFSIIRKQIIKKFGKKLISVK